jgi:hypothetical protein
LEVKANELAKLKKGTEFVILIAADPAASGGLSQLALTETLLARPCSQLMGHLWLVG